MKAPEVTKKYPNEKSKRCLMKVPQYIMKYPNEKCKKSEWKCPKVHWNIVVKLLRNGYEIARGPNKIS